MESASRAPAWLGLHVLLYSSWLVNALFIARHFLSSSPSPSRLGAANNDGGAVLSWALQAAREAESVAAADCSGHGRVFLDGVRGDDRRPGCECNTCSVRTPDYTADDDRWDHITFQLDYACLSSP